jgi:integrase
MDFHLESNGGRLRIRWQEPSGQRKAKAIGMADSKLNQIAGRAIIARIERDLITEGTFDRSLKKYLEIEEDEPTTQSAGLTVIEAFEDYMIASGPGLSKSSRGAQNSTRSYVLKLLGDAPFESIGESEAKAFRRSLEVAGLKGATIKKHLNNLSRCWDETIAGEGLAIANPWSKVRQKIRIDQAPPPEPFNPDEAQRIIAGFREHCPHYADYVEFCLLIGCRLSEAIGLKWDHVSRDCRSIWIGETLTRGERRSAKSGAGVIGLSPALIALFKRRRRSGELVFVSIEGKPIDDGNFRDRYWKPMLKRLGIAYRYPRNARHTYVSNNLDQGVSPLQIAAVTRHDVQTLFKNYAHKIGGAEVKDYLSDGDNI